jgi:hypothetical protein
LSVFKKKQDIPNGGQPVQMHYGYNYFMKAQGYGAIFATVGLLGVMPAFTNIRLGPFQPEDFVLLLLLWFCIHKFICSCFSFRIASKLSGLLRSYSLLISVLLVLSVLALRLAFFPLDQASFLKQPVIFSLSRILQFAAIVCGFLWLTNVFMRSRSLLASGMSAYWFTGIFCSLYAILSYFALAVFRFPPPEIFGAYSNVEGVLRARGFFNEGGPFGVYLVSVFVLGLLRRHMTGRRLGVVNIVLVSIAFLLSASKAGFFAAALLGLYSVVSAASFRKKVLYFILTAAVLCCTALWLDLGNQLLGYLVSYQDIEQQIDTRGNDYNLVLGRVSGLIIVPKMIWAHPLTGIGYGNYPLMRNDPVYLGPLPKITEVEDLPGLGIPGIAAEVGIPATLWLMMLLFAPYWWSRGQAAILGVAALFQPLAHVFAVQLTFFYPWFVSACALAASYYGKRGDN